MTCKKIIIVLIALSTQLLYISCQAQGRTSKYLLTNVNVVPMTDSIILFDQNVMVTDGFIISVYPLEQGMPDGDYRVIECNGSYLLPGLIDMHIHLESIKRETWPVSHLNLYLAHGVTSVRDLHGQDFINEIRDSVAAGNLPGPHIIIYPPIIRGYEENYPELIQKYHDEGYEGIKLYSYFSQNDFKAAMKKPEIWS